jgi:threonine dehydratase
VETLNPIRSFKGRGADFLVQELLRRGRVPPLVCASAGNFGQGLAYACRKRGIPLTVHAARNANPLKVERMRALSAEVRLAGDDFDGAKELAYRSASETGALMVVDGEAPEITEGAGSIGVELLASGEAFDAVLVPLGDGALLNGIARWVKHVAPTTRMIGVCSSGAPAVAESFRRGPGAPVVTHQRTETIADGIAVRLPIPEAVADMHGLVDDVLLVDDRELIEAIRLVHRDVGLVVEPAGVAGVAALLNATAGLRGQRVATVLCGSNVAHEQLRAWLD